MQPATSPGAKFNIGRDIPALWPCRHPPLLVQMPELGKVDRRAITAFSGVATRYLDNYLRWFQRLELENASPRACLATAIARPCIQFVN